MIVYSTMDCFSNIYESIEGVVECMNLPDGVHHVYVYSGVAEAQKIEYYTPCVVDDMVAKIASDYSSGWVLNLLDHADNLQKVVDEAISKYADEHDLHPQFCVVSDYEEIRVKVIIENGFIKIVEDKI